MRVSRRLIYLGCLLVALGGGGVGRAASIFTVTSTLDAVDAQPGDGVCATAAGECTLRAAVQEANAFAGADTISLPAGSYGLSLSGRAEDAAATGDLDVRAPVAIVGAGSAVTTIDANGIDRVLDVHPGSGSVRLQGVVLRGGSWVPLTVDRLFGGGILNDAELSLVDSAVVGNTAGGLTSGLGGGIYNSASGVLLLERSAVSNNSAGTVGGGVMNLGSAELIESSISHNSARSEGGGVVNRGTLQIRRSVIESNATLQSGGGISSDGTLVLVDSSVTANSVQFRGGGLATSGTVSIERSTLSGNRTTDGSDHAGGGALAHSGGSLSLVNSTVSGNRTLSRGGGIWVQGGNITVAYSTIADNSIGGGLRLEAAASGSVRGTLLADNTANCDGPTTPTSLGYNLEDSTSCGLAGPGDLSAIDPLLGPLADNGGPTFTRALPSGSAAIDASTDTSCPSTDQRGVPRPQGARCDIGAYEVTQATPAQLLAALSTAVIGVGPGTSLADKVARALAYLNSGDVSDTCSTLTAFINELTAQSGKKVPQAQAATLIASGQQIKTLLGC